MDRNKNQKIIKVPRYHGLLFLVLPFILYSALNFSLVGTIFLDELVTYSTKLIPRIEQLVDRDIDRVASFRDPEIRIKRLYVRDFTITVLVIVIVVFFFNLPIKMFFYKKRKNKKISPFIRRYTRGLINFSPEIIAGIILLGTLYMHYSFFSLYTNVPVGSNMKNTIKSILIVSIFTSTLVLLLIYFGQKFRIQTRFIDHAFPEERLRSNPVGFNFPGLKGRFFITTIFLTFVPLGIVIFYVISSFNTVNNVENLSEAEFDFLFGNIVAFITKLTGINPESFIDSFGLVQLFTGIIPGLFFSLIYILKMVNWSNQSILKPINELLKSMQEVSKGNLDSYTVVRSREETGQLSHGFNIMLDGLKDRDRVKSLFGQYLSTEISEEILEDNIDLNGSLYNATILFSDIRGFTTISESISPNETISFLNEYYNVIIDVIHENGGIIDKFMGDGVLVLFGVPIRSKDHANRAVATAFAMRSRLELFNTDRVERGLFSIDIGIGIYTGEVVAGNVGNSRKLEYTVIGDTVNIASRIESLTKKFESPLLIGESVYNSLTSKSDKKRFQKLDGIVLKGKRVKVNLFKIIN